MKPTKQQREVINRIIGELTSWKQTNDIHSATLQSDIDQMLDPVQINPAHKDLIRIFMRQLLYAVQIVKP